MTKENHGNSWEQEEELRLEEMLYAGASYQEMARDLGRTWFACKCRLIKLKLIPFEPQSKNTNVERYDVPLRYVDKVKQTLSNTFNNVELNTIAEYCTSRLARLAIQKLNTEDPQLRRDIIRAEEFFMDELSKIKIMKKIPFQERDKILTKFA